VFDLSVLDVDRLRLLLLAQIVVGNSAGDGLGYRSSLTGLTMVSMTVELGSFDLNLLIHLKATFMIGKLTPINLLLAGFSPELQYHRL